MFETAVVHAQARRPQQRVGLFTASVALHSAVAIAAIAISIQSISFPTSAPNQIEIFTPMVPLPMTGGGGAVKPATPEPPKPQPAAQQQITAPPQPTAPTTVPDAVPTVASSAEPGPIGTGPVGTGSGPVGTGIGEGPGPGTGIGEGPGIGDAVPDVIFQPGADVRSAVVLSRVQPGYPPIALRARLGGLVTVHCVIDRNGRIRDPQVIRSTSSMFDQAAVDAVKQWTFAPGTMHGKAVDTYFELTVTFAVR